MGKYCFGVDLGGTTVKLGLFSTEGDLLEKWEIPTNLDNGGDAILPDIAKAILKKEEEKGISKEDVVGIGMGVPAPVLQDGIVKRTTNLGWGYKEVKAELEAYTGTKVKVANDANIAALGEMWKGGGQGYKNLVMVTLGTGVGGGIIIDGHIYSGANGAGGEIGHILMNADETELCGCGKSGCLEQYASATGIVRLAKRYLVSHDTETVLDVENLSAKTVFDAVKAGDAVAKEIAEEFGKCLGYALTIISTIIDPEAFVIGGGVSKAGEIILDCLQKYYEEKAFWTSKGVKMELAKLGNDAGIYGGACLALE